MRALILHTASSVLGRCQNRPERPASSPPTAPGGYRLGLRAVTPLLPAVLAFGVSFGVLAQAAGMGASASIVMSLTTFAGSAQFAVVSVLGAGGTAAAAIAAAVLLNARYAPMALAAGSVFRGGKLRRLLEAQLLVDESWALARREGGFDRRVLIGAGARPLRRLERRHGHRRRGGRFPRRPGHARSRRRVPRALPRIAGAAPEEPRRPRRRHPRRRHRASASPRSPRRASPSSRPRPRASSGCAARRPLRLLPTTSGRRRRRQRR